MSQEAMSSEIHKISLSEEGKSTVIEQMSIFENFCTDQFELSDPCKVHVFMIIQHLVDSS